MQSDPPAPNAEQASASGTLVLSLPPDPSRYQKQLEAIMDIAWAVSSTLHIDSLLPRIMEKVTGIIKADRSTFFIVDRPNNALWSKVVQGGVPEEIRLGIGEGVAGWVAQSGQTVNLADAHEDPRFDRTWDEQSGYRTRSLLCVPIYDRNMSVIAVIQCLNKQGRRRFDDEDEELLRCVSGQCGIALESAFLYEAVLQRNRALQEAEARVRRANTELEMLYDLERQISQANDPETLVRDILERACSLLKMESAAILLVSDGGGQVFAAGRAGSGGPYAVDPRRARGLLSRAQLPTYRASDETGALADVIVPKASAAFRARPSPRRCPTRAAQSACCSSETAWTKALPKSGCCAWCRCSPGRSRAASSSSASAKPANAPSAWRCSVTRSAPSCTTCARR